MAELPELCVEAFDDQRALRRSARLRKLKESKGKVVSEYFSQPVSNSAARLGSKRPSRGRKRKSDQTRLEVAAKEKVKVIRRWSSIAGINKSFWLLLKVHVP